MKSCPGRLVLAVGLAALPGCGGGGPGSPAPRAAVAGQWVDLRKTAPGDTMVWVLEPNGRDDLLHITIEPTPGGPPLRRERREHYGRWTLATLPGDSTQPALCFNRRPGRQAASCSAFRLDTLPADSGGLRRLQLAAYQGQHHQADRILIERRP